MKEYIGEIRYSGVFDYDAFYKGVHKWFKERLYDVYETTYKHKVSKKGLPEVELAIKGERKQTEWLLCKANIEIHIYDLAEVEVVKDGKKQKLSSGRLTAIITIEVVFDYEKRFEKTPFYVWLYNFLVGKVLLMKLVLGPVDTQIYEGYTLHAEVKKLLNMNTAYNAF